VVPAEDDRAFSRAVIRLLDEPALATRLGQAAARRIAEKYNWITLSEVLEQAYR
jgi:glycosyltransferase involved in cell wall biosynthesis